MATDAELRAYMLGYREGADAAALESLKEHRRTAEQYFVVMLLCGPWLFGIVAYHFSPDLWTVGGALAFAVVLFVGHRIEMNKLLKREALLRDGKLLLDVVRMRVDFGPPNLER